MKSKRGMLVVACVIAAALIAALIVVRSRNATEVSPEQVTATSSEPRDELLDPARAVSPTVTETPATEGDEPSAATPVLADAQRVDRSPTARFRGRLVYESTREPVPWCIVAVRAPGQAGELRVTDEDGHFKTSFEYPATKLDVLAADETTLPYSWHGAQSVEHLPTNSSEVEIPVRVWPTIFIDGGMPDGRDPRRWQFQLGRCLSPSETRVTRSGVMWRNHSHFRPDMELLDELQRTGPPWWLVIDDEQKNLCCVIALERLDGVIHVSLQWQKHGALDVTLKTNLRELPDWEVSLALRPVLTRNDDMPHSANIASRTLHLGHLRPGTFVLDVSSEFCQTAHVPVTIRAGETTKVEVSLACEQPTGSIVGVVTTKSGKSLEFTDEEEVSVLLRNAADGDVIDRGNILWTRDEGTVTGKFELRDLPSRNYELSLAPNCSYTTQPRMPLTVRPGDEVQITLLDVGSTIDVGFDVVDKQTGIALEDFMVSAKSGPRHWSLRSTRPHTLVIDDVRENSRVSWCISMFGFTSVCGTLESASKSWTVDGKQRWVRVELERGASVNVFVCSSSRFTNEGPPIADAAVLIDGREVGRTDSHGKFATFWPTTGSPLDVRYLDWRHSSLPYSQPSIVGGFCSDTNVTTFILEPP